MKYGLVILGSLTALRLLTTLSPIVGLLRQHGWSTSVRRSDITGTGSQQGQDTHTDGFHVFRQPRPTLGVKRAPRRDGRDAVGGRQATGLLRDQIRSCVPSSPSIRRA
jgi:hypothetical protein